MPAEIYFQTPGWRSWAGAVTAQLRQLGVWK